MFGQAGALDFSLCAGLGVAAACCTVAAFAAVNVIDAKGLQEGWKNALKSVLGLLSFGAILSIATVIGDTKPFRDPGSILGFSAGVLAVGLLAVVIKKIR